MDIITVTFLGTGNAVPTKLRNHTAILVSFQNENILIDCGEGTQRQFKVAEISPHKLTKLLITHWHGDHVLGIPGLFQTLAMSDYQKTLQIYGPRGTSRSLSLTEELFKDLKIKFLVSEKEGLLVDTPSYSIESLQMSHGIPTHGYSITLKDHRRLDKAKLKKLKLPNSPLLGELQAGKDIIFEGKKIKSKDVSYMEPGKKLTIILDTGITPAAVALAKKADLLILESTFSSVEAEKAKEYLHLTAKDAATIAKKAKVKSLILTHISQRYEHSPHIIESEARRVFKNTKVVKDLDIVTL